MVTLDLYQITKHKQRMANTVEIAVFPSPDWSLEDLEDWILMEEEAIQKEEREMALILAMEETTKEEHIVLANESSGEGKTRHTVDLGTGKTTTSMLSHERKHTRLRNQICNRRPYRIMRRYGNHKLIKEKLKKSIFKLADSETKNCEKWRKILRKH